MSGAKSLMKKEIRLRRKPKAQTPESASPASEPKAETPQSGGKSGGKSFMKKEIRLRRKPKTEAPESASTASEPKAKRSRPKLSRPSLPSVSMPTLSLPSAPKRKGRHGKVDRVVGLKIGGSQIAAACIANNGSAKLEQIARTPLASGIVSGGELRDTQALADALRTFFEENNLPRQGVRLGVASSRIVQPGHSAAGIRRARPRICVPERSGQRGFDVALA